MPLVLICGGPGTGKTVLLTEWVRNSDEPVGWFSPKPDDNEPVRFWSQLRAAAYSSGAFEGKYRALDARGDSTGDGLFGALIRDMRHPQFTLVIDEAHLVNNPQILDGLDSIVRAGNPRLVLAARSDPMLPLHRYRLGGQMFELRAADLAMTDSEAHALLEAHGVTLPPTTFDVLATRTEGWTAGIRLSAMRMEGTGRPADFVAEFAVDQGSIGEYLTYEVLDHLPERSRRMLIQTGFLEVVTGELANVVTGIDECGEILADLARTNAFVIPLDAAHTRFRYHHLLAEILRYMLQHQGHEPQATLFGRAASWFEGQQDYQTALHWALQAGDTERAVSLLARRVVADVFVRRARIAQSELLDLLPLEIASDSADIRVEEAAIARSAIDALTADRESAARRLRRIEQQTPTAELPSDLQVSASLSMVMLGQRVGDGRAVETAASQVLAVDESALCELPRGVRARAMIAHAKAQFWDYRHDGLDSQLEAALSLAEQDGLDSVGLEALGMLALVNAFWSKTSRGAQAEERARELLESSVELVPPLTLQLAVAHRAALAADFATMGLAVRRALIVTSDESDVALLALTAQMHGWLLLESGQAASAKTVLDEAPRLPGGAAMLQSHRGVLLASIETRLGRPYRALRLLDENRSDPPRAESTVAAAKAHLALGDLRSAEDCVRKVVAGPGTQVGRGSLVDALLCNAQVAQRRDEHERAVEFLFRAIEIADGDVMLPFAQVGDTFAPTLNRHPLVVAKWPIAAQYIKDEVTVEALTKAARGVPEPLTEREQVVLRFLSTTMSTAEIADELFLSVNTIKTHLGSIYRKLAVGKRRDAVVRARELELL